MKNVYLHHHLITELSTMSDSLSERLNKSSFKPN